MRDHSFSQHVYKIKLLVKFEAKLFCSKLVTYIFLQHRQSQCHLWTSVLRVYFFRHSLSSQNDTNKKYFNIKSDIGMRNHGNIELRMEQKKTTKL